MTKLTTAGKIVVPGFSIAYNTQSAITCANASEYRAVVLFELSNQTTITNENHCIHIQGTTGYDVIRAADTFAYEILGVR